MDTLNCNGILLDITSPVVMGIINLTDDSFYALSRYDRIDKTIERVAGMIDEGVSIIDLGAASSRPGAKLSNPEDEVRKLVPVYKALRTHFPEAIISIDTYHSKVVSTLLDLGANMINDISAGAFDLELIRVLSRYNAAYVLMHMRGIPEHMAVENEYEDLILDLLRFYAIKLRTLKEAGIKDIMIDPGFGFAKNIAQNFKLLQQLSTFRIFENPILVGLSRKSMIWKSLNITAEEALNGTSVLHAFALENGARILRVHDVKEAVETIRLWQKLKLA